MIVEAGTLGLKDDGLEDLSVLVDGFLALVRSAAESRTSPDLGPRAPIAPIVSTVPSRPTEPTVPVAASAPSVSASPAPAAGPRVYSIDDRDVSPPVALEQQMPVMTKEMQTILRARSLSGVLDVVIDETGRVVQATFRQSLQANFDAQIVRSALRWKYSPAMKDGVPVRYVKTVLLVP